MDQIKSLDPNNQYSFEQIAALGQIGKRLAQHIMSIFDEAVRTAHKTHADILQVRGAAVGKFDEVEGESKRRLAQGREAHPEFEADGASFSDKWVAEVTDATFIPREYLMPDMKKIQGVASALKGECRIPGVRVRPVVQVAFRVNA